MQVDADIVIKFKNGDLSIFNGLVRRYQDKIYNLCRYMLGDTGDAQDAAQDVFIKAYKNLGHFKPDASFYT